MWLCLLSWRKQNTFGGGDLSTNVLKVLVRSYGGINKAFGVHSACYNQEKVVGEGAGRGVRAVKEAHPRANGKGDEEHGEGAALGNAAEPFVSRANA